MLAIPWALVLFGCGGSGQQVEVAAGVDRTDALYSALETAERQDYKSALAQFRLLKKRDTSQEAILRVGYGLFLTGDVKGALASYRHYLENETDINAWDREEIKNEIKRIDRALQSGEDLKGSSLASRRVRAELALLRFERSLEKKDYKEGFKQLDIASQYLPDPELVFEAALLATKAELYADAIKKFRIFLALAAAGVTPTRAFGIQAEIDRLMSILDGQEPVTWISLADQIYEERKAAVRAAQAARGGSAAGEDLAAQEEATKPSWETHDGWISSDKVAKAQKAPEKKPESEPESRPESESKPEPEPGEPVVAAVTVTKEKKIPEPTLEELLFYSKSRNSAVRLKAIKDLAAFPSDRARLALEDRMLNDQNIHIRLMAIIGLEKRKSVASIPIIRRAVMTAASSSERARLKKAVKTIMGVD